MSLLNNIYLNLKGTYSIKLIRILVFCLFISLIFYVGYRYNDYKVLRNNPDLAALRELTQINKHLSKFMVFPKDDPPTIATVTDVEKLKSYDFLRQL